MISWVAPAVLGAGVLVALPFAIHWLTRQRTVARFFPPLAFLARVDGGRSRWNRLRERGILLLRALAIGCLIAAAAGAIWRGQLGGAQRPMVVVLDASASMRQEVAGATAWERARATAGELLRSAGGRSVAAVVAQDVPLRSGVEVTPSAGPALALLSETEPCWGDGDPAAAIGAAAALLPQGGDIILVTDLARGCLSGVDPESLPTGVTLSLVDCGP
ncbi:MAG: BatA and WFA domain-containing protein, partial [Planctomycetota bacterium]